MIRKIAILILAMVAGLLTTSTAEVPRTITYQGRLTNDAGEPLTGSYDMTFSIYNQPTGGAALWSSGPRTVAVFDGLFTYALGSNVVLPSGLVADTTLWLGVQVGSDPELSPRTKLTSEAFAFAARTADSLTGDHYVLNTGDTIDGDLLLTESASDRMLLRASSYAKIKMYDASEGETAMLTAGTDGGAFQRLMSGDESSRIHLDAWETGSSMRLYNGDATVGMVFDTRLSGTAAVTLPEGSIHSLDIANEPGIAGNDISSGVFVPYWEMADLVSVTITIPDDGYLLLFGNSYIRFELVPVSSSLFAGIQIDETTGGGTSGPSYQRAGFSEFPDIATVRLHLSTQRTYFKSAGTYTFILEGRKSDDYGSVFAWNSQLTALYLPTSYGSVETAVSSSDVDAFESARVQSFKTDSDRDEGSTESVYKVDLRQLELRAARERAEAERAQRELLEEKLRIRNEEAQQ